GARRRVPPGGAPFEASRKIPEDVFATGRQAIVEDLLDAELAPLHTGTVALGIRHVLCTPLRLVGYAGAPHARLSREAREKAKFEKELRVPAAFQQALWPASSRAGTFVTTAATSIPCR